MKGHESIRPYVETADDLYRLIHLTHGEACASLGRRVFVMLGLLAAGFVSPGAWGSTAFCLAAVAGVACITAAMDVVTRTWFMHLITLRDLLVPPLEQGSQEPESRPIEAPPMERVH